MKDLVELIQYLYKKYFNQTDSLMILEKVIGGKKFEYSYIDNLIMLSIKKNISHYELLLLLGDKKLEEKIKKINILVEEYINKDISVNREKILNTFIKDWNVDLKEIDFLTLQLLNNYMKN